MTPKVQLGLKAVLILLSAYFVYAIYTSIMKPIEFNRYMDTRKCQVTVVLEDIREAQLAYKSKHNRYCGDLNELIAFVDTGHITRKERIDTSYMYYDERYGMDRLKEEVIWRVKGKDRVLTDKFPEGFMAESMRYIPGTKKEFSVNADIIKKDGVKVPVFEAAASFSDVFADLAEDYAQEFKAVRSKTYKVGSLTEAKISGNYENADCNKE